MSASIDQRIVSMKFDNNQFQNGVSDSLKSINDLKKGLNFDGATKGLDSIGTAANKVSFGGLSSGLESIKSQFSALQVVAITALVNISNSAINAGKQLISSLTIDPILDGYREYETQMNSIQTILANTSSKGTTLDQVKAALAELNTYSDKTIYNFTEMTRNIGTFTAAGISLDKSTSAIKGIANLAAMSGSSSEQASTAMYQLSQALASGTVKLQDWNSVVNAGMGGEVFQNALKETARVHGVAVDKIIKGEGSFRESLQKGWVTSEIMTETLSKFTGDLTAAQLKTMGYTDKQIEGIMKMAQTANDAATKVKTMTQLIDTLKEAVGSGWAQTWQTVFGDFEEAKVLFTNISNVLGGLIGKTSEARNEMLKGWKDLGGRTALIDSIANAFNSVMSIADAVGKALRDVFPATTSKQLFDITNMIKTFSEHLKLGDTTLNNIRSTFKGFFAILDIGKNLFVGVANAIGTLLGGVGNLGNALLNLTASFGEWLTALDNSIKSSDIINKTLQPLARNLNNAFNGVGDSLQYFGAKFEEIRNSIVEKIDFDPWESFNNVLNNIGKAVEFISEKISELQSKLSDMLTNFGQKFNGIDVSSKIKSTYDGITKLLVDQGNEVEDANTKMESSFTTSMSNFVRNLGSISMAAIGLAISKMVLTITEKIRKKGGIDSIFDGLKEAVSGGIDQITSTLDAVKGSLKAYQDQLKAGLLIKIATAIAILAASIVAISLVDSAKLATSLAAIGGLFAQLLVAMKLFTMIGEFKGSAIKSSIVMITMSTAILILSNAMVKLGTLDITQTITSLGAILAMMAMMTGVMKILSKDSGTFTKGALSIIAFAESIKILSEACINLSKLNTDQLIKGVAGLGAVMLELSIFLNKTNPTLGIKNAAGILILSLSLNEIAKALSKIGDLDWEVIKKGLMGMGLALLEVAAFDKILSNAKNMVTSAAGLAIVSLSLSKIAENLNTIGSLDWEVIKKGLMGMGLALVEIAIFTRLSSGISGNIKSVISLTILTLSLNRIAENLNTIGSLDWEVIKKGLKGMGLALLELAVFTKLSSGISGNISSVISLGIAVSALSTLGKSLQTIGELSWETIKKGLIGMGGALVEMTIMLNSLSKSSPIKALALIEICTALNILTKAFIGFETLTWGGIAKSIVAMGLALTVIAVVLKGLPSDSLLTALGLTGIASAMVTLSKALIALAGISFGGIVKGIFAIGGCLVVLAGGIKLMEGSLSGILVLMLAAAALNLLVPPILQLSTISWDGLLKSLVTLAGVFTILGIAAVVLSPVIPAVYALSAALVILGIAVVAIGAGVALAAAGFNYLSQCFNNLGTTTQQNAENIKSTIATMIAGIIEGIATAMPNLIKQIGDGIVLMAQAIATNAPLVLNNMLKMLADLLDVIIKWTPTLAQKFLDLVLAMLKVVADNMGKFVSAGVDIVVSFLNGVANNLQRVIDAAFDLIIKFVNGLADAIRSNSGALADAGYNLATAVIDAVGTLHGKMVDVGIYAVEGFINGLASIPGKVWAAGARIGAKALEAAKAALDSHSPSREFRKLGEFSGQGFIIGLDSYNKKVEDTSYGVGTNAVDSMSNAIAGISDVINGNMDSSPVIRPVLDLTDVMNGTNNMNSLLNGNYNIDTSSTNSKASSLSGSINSNIQNGNGLMDVVVSNINRLNENVGKLQDLFANEQPIYLTNITNLDSKVIARETVPLVSNKLALNVNMRR